MTDLNSNATVEHELDRCIEALEAEVDADCLTFVGGLVYGEADDVIREPLEERTPKRPRLAFILETPGGYIEVVQRIAETIASTIPRWSSSSQTTPCPLELSWLCPAMQSTWTTIQCWDLSTHRLKGRMVRWFRQWGISL